MIATSLSSLERVDFLVVSILLQEDTTKFTEILPRCSHRTQVFDPLLDLSLCALPFNDPVRPLVLLCRHLCLRRGPVCQNLFNGSAYWKQNSRKVFAVPEQQFLDMRSKRRRLSQRDDDSQLPEVLERIEEVVLASQELPEVAQAIRGLSELTLARRRFITFTDEELCCQSLIACKVCFDQWQRNANTCVKCRGDNSRENTYRVTGIDGALSAFGDLIKD
ncbi:unnamed protein product [Leuciscus chuanchicus]